MQRETAKPSDLNALTGGQCLRHVVNQQLDRQLNVFRAQLALTVGHQVNQFAPRHAVTPCSLWAFWPSPRALASSSF
jgi:hypothetical protein